MNTGYAFFCDFGQNHGLDRSYMQLDSVLPKTPFGMLIELDGNHLFDKIFRLVPMVGWKDMVEIVDWS